MDGTTRAQLRSVSGAAASPAGRAPIPYYNYRKSYYNYFTRQSLDYGVGGATRRHLAETAGIGTGVGLRLDVDPEPEEEDDESSSSALATSPGERKPAGETPSRKHCLHFASMSSGLGSVSCTV